MRLTNKMIAAARQTPAGKYLDDLIAEDVKLTGGLSLGGGASIIEQLWKAMMAAKDHAPTS